MQRAELAPLGNLISAYIKSRGNFPRFTGVCDFDLQDLKARCLFDIYQPGTLLGSSSNTKIPIFMLVSGKAEFTALQKTRAKKIH